MTIDLTGGFGAELELPFATQPDEPDMRESMNAWIWDEGTAAGIPRIGIEAVADQWETHEAQVNIGLGDGRCVNLFAPGKIHDPLDAAGNPRILGAGPLSFEVVEPYRHLRMRLAGEAHATTVQAQIEGAFPGQGDPIEVEAEVDIRPAVPPWMNGALLDDARRVLETQEEGPLMGYPWRFEQLCRAEGFLRVGDQRFEIHGGANRIRRQSIRRTALLRGHAWQAALFPSGRGFGYIAYPPRDDGKDTYNEGYLFDGDGPLVPARVVEAPWLRELKPTGQDVSCVLEAVDGRRVRIGGETAISTFMIMPPEVGGGLQLQQAITRYTWDDESANGMLERSSHPEIIA